MTEPELAELLRDCPTLYHMAEAGSWPSIRTHGLLSTSALLDLHRVQGERRAAIESERRPEAVRLDAEGLFPAIIRDQKPMDDAGLRRCLEDGLVPADWYRILNAKVFFWLTRERLQRLIGAKPYRGAEHLILELDAAALVEAHAAAITLSPINSGATRPFGRNRGLSTFQPMADYPYAHWRARRPRGERVVELAVERGVPDAARFVRRMFTARGGQAVSLQKPP